MQKPEIGTMMFYVVEHLYYTPEHTAPETEYVIAGGTVSHFFQGGFADVCLKGWNANGFPCPVKVPLNSIGKKLFYTYEEAVKLAEEKTDHYEQVWGHLEKKPLRRPWRLGKATCMTCGSPLPAPYDQPCNHCERR